jgi:signal peptidase I
MSQPADEAQPEIPKPLPAPLRDEAGVHIKETIESILVAFILAFIFRCFVVEPFVIPTGSMAPTLLGAHTRHRCPECGYTFDVDYRPPSNGIDDEPETPSYAGPLLRNGHLINTEYDSIRCPNCGYLLPPQINPPVHFGDRVVVLKYAELLEKLKRWDVVVFKTPYDPEHPEHRFEWNFIKRLVGLPGETVMVLDGGLYVKSPGSDQFIVQTKTPEAQEALWRIIYDDDYRPLNVAPRTVPWVQPWQMTSGAGWSDHLPSSRSGFSFENATGTGTLTFNSSAGRTNNAEFKDYLAYDQRPTPNAQGYDGDCIVSDLKLDLYYDRKQGEGPLRLLLSKLDDRFIAEILPNRVLLHHEYNGREIGTPQAVEIQPPTSGPHHFQFSNVDYRVTLRMDGRVLLQTTPQQYHPDIDQLKHRLHTRAIGPLPEVRIFADHQTCQLTHLSLWRDIYYTQNDGGSSAIIYGAPEEGRGDTGPVQLGPGEYFVLGDNSPMSGDARFFTQPVNLPNEWLYAEGGRVPERLMLGRAFFVYWPAGFRPAGLPGLIPNFGEMRFIR